jgi:hypothetical protein
LVQADVLKEPDVVDLDVGGNRELELAERPIEEVPG